VPELPDLLHIQRYLRNNVSGRTITGVDVKQPVVLRVASEQSFHAMLSGKTIGAVEHHGPFLCLTMNTGVEVVINLMVAGSLQHQREGEKPRGYLCFSLEFEDHTFLHLCDEKLMAKVYVVPAGDYTLIPKYADQGIDILSGKFTLDRFHALVPRGRRRQVRVFLRDHTLLSAIGNAYADEILFEAGIHPKTFLGKLAPDRIEALYNAIRSVMRWGIDEVERARAPIDVKVRGHMKIRNRKGEPCVRCRATIRREGVRGYDTYFCPVCQPATRKHFLDWTTVS